jgi:arsenite methyltransferase
MAATAPIGFDIERLRTHVKDTYSRVVREPDGDFHFNRGAEFAVSQLGYDAKELAALPRATTDAFAGVANPHRLGPLEPGETVLDIGCGAGTDLLLAAQRVAPTGRAIGIDMTAAMREQARAAAEQLGLSSVVDVRAGMAGQLPVEDASIDVVMSNGVLNLAANKRTVFAEIVRVLRPGGRLHLADVVVQRELSLAARNDVDLWAA